MHSMEIAKPMLVHWLCAFEGSGVIAVRGGGGHGGRTTAGFGGPAIGPAESLATTVGDRPTPGTGDLVPTAFAGSALGSMSPMLQPLAVQMFKG